MKECNSWSHYPPSAEGCCSVSFQTMTPPSTALKSNPCPHPPAANAISSLSLNTCLIDRTTCAASSESYSPRLHTNQTVHHRVSDIHLPALVAQPSHAGRMAVEFLTKLHPSRMSKARRQFVGLRSVTWIASQKCVAKVLLFRSIASRVGRRKACMCSLGRPAP